MRKQIRDAVKNAISGLSLFYVDSVAIGRRHHWTADQLPAVSIFTDTEEQERNAMRRFGHQLDLVVRLEIKPDGIDCGEDKNDELIAAIDSALVSAVRSVGGVFDVWPSGLDIDGDGTADADYLRTNRTYTVLYHTAEA